MTSIERALITFVAMSLGLAIAVSAVGAESGGARILASSTGPIPVSSALSLKGADNAGLRTHVEEVMHPVFVRQTVPESADATGHTMEPQPLALKFLP